MQTKEQTVEVLNDLIKINNDRIAGYERAINETRDLDVDLKSIFQGMIEESKGYKKALTGEVTKLEGDAEDETTISGKIYRAWMDVKASFTGRDRKTILENCEFGEDAWRRAYESALSVSDDYPDNVRNLIREQYDAQRSSHDLIKKYRDAHAAA